MDDETPVAPGMIATEDEFAGEYDDDDAAYDAADEPVFAAPGDGADQLRALVGYMATNLVDDPATVEVEARQRGGSVFVSLRVPEEELGKVIGRGGRIARAMRTALMIAGARHNVRATLDIED